ncbi:hypothetical protein BKA82DRAFT_995166 [Pisolithus tinctorius]|uniref:RING-type domain-containing protein n=1 Tax=Pisolithus tinctorius Marx 270 TaxID=870435 RepID=A0A0C3JNB1_PISTI|nr:hypothetical protein BKA82DRAFT_995166 [Pisolithus tinctorius]KIO10688.1 hypothetical protein M404DRAFT_995166 [Pisolithus tinctorius Marx 270]
MADCGICLEALKKPVSTPCGHVHCEACLRNYIVSSNDALKSTCPTCRREFHIATPDLAVVPEKYHGFILPTIRKLYIDIPSTSKLVKKVNSLKTQVKDLSKEIDLLDERCDGLEREVQAFAEAERATRIEMRALQNEYEELSYKYDSMVALCTETHCSPGPSRSSHNNDATTSLDNAALPVQLRPKRALPKSRPHRSARHSDVPNVPLVSKRQRVSRHSDVHDIGRPPRNE